MKAVHVVRQFHPSVGGLEGAVLSLCGALEQRGVATKVVTLDRISSGAVPGTLPATDRVSGIPVRRIPFRGSWRYPIAPGVIGCLAQADVVHVHGIDFFYDFLAATKPIHGKPLVASTHGGFFHTSFARRLKQVYFATVTRAATSAYDAVCASSESDFALFRPIAGRKLVLAVNGVDTQKWSGAASPTVSRRLIYIGRFSSNKNITAIFPVLHALRQHHPDWVLTLAGQPWDVTASTLLQAARHHGVGEAVSILAAPSDNAIRQAIAQSSYVVSASRHEGFGISIVEGLSAGLVPILSHIPPFESLIAAAHCGSLVDFGQADACAAAIERLHQNVLADPARLRARAKTAASAYSWDAAADTTLDLYRSSLDGRRRRAAITPAGSLS